MPRTNNSVEAWHNAIVMNPKFNELAEKIRVEQSNNENKKHSIKWKDQQKKGSLALNVDRIRKIVCKII